MPNLVNPYRFVVSGSSLTSIVDHPTLPTDIVAYYSLEEHSSNAFSDSVGGNTLTTSNGVLDQTGIIDNCWNSSTNGVASASGIVLTSPVNYSVSCWFYANAAGTLISQTNNTSTIPAPFDIQMNHTTGVITVVTGNGTTYAVKSSSGSAWTPLTWQHLVLTFNDTTNALKVYINNSLVINTTETTTVGDGTSNVYFNLCNQKNSSANHMNALIDEVGLWSKELTASEVEDLYNSGAGLPYKISSLTTVSAHSTLPTNLVSYYSFNDSLVDEVSSYDGTVSGTVTYGTGIINKSVIPGTTSYINFGDITELNATTAYSINFWLHNASIGNKGLFQKRTSNTEKISFDFAGSVDYYPRYGASTDSYATYKLNSMGIVAGGMYMITLVFDGSGSTDSDRFKTYVNGIEKPPLGYTFSPPTITGNLGNFHLGVALNGTWYSNPNEFSEFGIWDKALTLQEIRDLYNSGNGIPYS